MPVTMTARYPGTCPICTGAIQPGNQIASVGANRGFAHLACQAAQAPVSITPAMVVAAALPAANLPGIPAQGYGPKIDATNLPAIEKVATLPTGATYVAVDAGLGVGGLFMWSGSGQTDRARLQAALDDRGLGDLMPRAATLEEILRRALARGKRTMPGRTIVSTVSRGTEWAIVQEQRERSEDGGIVLTHRTLLHAAVVVRKPEETPFPGTEIRFTRVADGMDWLTTAIRADHLASRDHLSVDDVTAWMQTVLAGKYGAVQVMPSFRQYFVPADAVPAVRELCAAVRAATSYEVYEIPAMRSAEATTAILAALEREAVAAAQEIQTDLEERVRAVETADAVNGLARRAATIAKRQAAVNAIQAKLTAYAERFGRPAEAAANQVERLRRNVFTALQYAEAKAEGREVDAPVLLDLDDREAPLPADPTSDGAEGRFAGIFADLD